VTTLYLSHPACLGHDTGPGHPERPDRVRVLDQMVEHERFAMLHRALAPGNDRAAILRVHPERYVDQIEAAVPKEGLVRLDNDTVLSPGSWEAIAHAVGGTTAAVNEVMRGNSKNAFVAIRPAGHHAETEVPMGFCFFNFAAIAARHAQKVHGAGRVAILDFDVHHGNGTQEIFWSDPSVLYGSTHQMPFYPGTGAADQRGEHDTIVNVPLAAGNTGREFLMAWEDKILPRVEEFQPDFIVISAGFDGHKRDPLGGLELVENDYSWVTRRIMDVAEKHAKGRIVSILEGGYDLEGLARSVAAHLLTLMQA
jgi:acetoin utilization deacetylase AcuC-like enzyme